MRLFVSVDFDGLSEEIASVQELFADASGVRATDPTSVHVTLKFLGEVERDRIAELTSALEAAVAETGVEPFCAEFGGLGAFPSREYVRVIWIGVREGSEELTRLHKEIEKHTVAIGFEPADHEFTPHATVARMDHAGGKTRVQEVLDTADPTVGTLRVEEVRLTESVLGEGGPEYTTVERFEM